MTTGKSEKTPAGIPARVVNDAVAALLEGSAEGVCLTDVEGVVLTFNGAAEILTGRNAGEVLGRPCNEAFRCDKPEACSFDDAAPGRSWAIATKLYCPPTPLTTVPSSRASEATAPFSATIIPVLMKRACRRWAQYRG